MADLEQSLTQFAARYRHACLAKVGVWVALGAGCVAAWRWRTGDGGMLTGAILPLGLSGLGVAGIALWLRRHWLSPRAAPGHLDAMLGLKERLLTAAEFVRAPQPPVLYPLLLQDVTGRLATGQVRVPRVFDRAMALLAIALLLLLAWPAGHRPGAGLLAQRPQAPTPRPPEPPPAAPEPPPPPPEPRHDPSSSGPQPPQPSTGSDQPQAGSSPDQSPSQGGEAMTASGADEGSPSSAPADGPSQGAGEPSQPSPASASPQPQRAGDAATKAQAATQPSQAGGSREPSSKAPATPSASTDDKTSAQPAEAAGQSQERQGQAQGPRGERQGASPQASASAGASPQTGQQGELTAEIRGLLQQMADELEQLEQQVAASQQPKPTPGMSTDPELFDGGAEELPSGGRGMPLSLETDDAPTQTPRPGGGLGERSEIMGRGGPRVAPDDASLSDAPRPEGASAARPPVPPDYRSVFDRLFQRRPPSEEPGS